MHLYTNAYYFLSHHIVLVQKYHVETHTYDMRNAIKIKKLDSVNNNNNNNNNRQILLN